MKTKRIVVDIPQALHTKFTKAIDRHGFKKKKVITELVDYWTKNAETAPHYFRVKSEQAKAAKKPTKS